MIVYLINRIISGHLTYELVIEKRPDLKEAIDTVLHDFGRQDLIKP